MCVTVANRGYQPFERGSRPAAKSRKADLDAPHSERPLCGQTRPSLLEELCKFVAEVFGWRAGFRRVPDVLPFDLAIGRVR